MNSEFGDGARAGGPARGIAALVASGAASTALFWLVGRSLPWGVDVQAAFLLVTFGLFLAVTVGYSWVVDHVWRRANREASSALAAFKIDFVADVSHELRTALTGIVGFAQLVDARLLGGDDAEAMNAVLSQSVELSRVVDDLVARARLDSGTMPMQIRPVPVVEQVRKAAAVVEVMGAGIDIECAEATIEVDPEAFRHVLRNLLANAHRHGLPPLTVRGRRFGDRYICQVIDRGQGVSADAESDLFNCPPVDVDEARPGAVGLGLVVVRELAERMGAVLSYQHIRGETHFVLNVPMAPASALTPEAAPARVSIPHVRHANSRQPEGV